MEKYKVIKDICDIENNALVYPKDTIVESNGDIITLFDGLKYIQSSKNGRYLPLNLLEKIEDEYPKYHPGEIVIYQNGDKFELGLVKRVCGGDEYFVYYHTGDTAARTHARNLHKVVNRYAFHIVRLDPYDNERTEEEIIPENEE